MGSTGSPGRAGRPGEGFRRLPVRGFRAGEEGGVQQELPAEGYRLGAELIPGGAQPRGGLEKHGHPVCRVYDPYAEGEGGQVVHRPGAGPAEAGGQESHHAAFGGLAGSTGDRRPTRSGRGPRA